MEKISFTKSQELDFNKTLHLEEAKWIKLQNSQYEEFYSPKTNSSILKDYWILFLLMMRELKLFWPCLIPILYIILYGFN